MATNNKVQDLTDYLFEEMQNLMDPEDDTPEAIRLEVYKAGAVCNIAKTINSIYQTKISAIRLKNEGIKEGFISELCQ